MRERSAYMGAEIFLHFAKPQKNFKHMKFLIYFFPIVLLLSGCIGDDIINDTVDPELRIMNPIDSLTVGQSHQFDATYFNNIGLEETVDIVWNSSDLEVLNVEDNGLATGIKSGSVMVSAEAESLKEEFLLTVTEETVINDEPANERSGIIQTTSFYTLEGNFTMRAEGNDLILEIDESYRASSGLPGLYLYLTNNPNSVNGAFEVGEVEVFSGAHSYTISGVGLNDHSHLLYFCKPFAVKVGDGEFEN